MSRIRGSGNKATEIAFMKLLRRHRISGWRRHVRLTLTSKTKQIGTTVARSSGRQLRVRPDFAFPDRKVAVFIDGCFWHACPVHCTKPRANASFWLHKLSDNRARDRYVDRSLRSKGWCVIRIWEHELRRGDRTMARFTRLLDSQSTTEAKQDVTRPPTTRRARNHKIGRTHGAN